MIVYIGVDIGGTTVKMGSFDLEGNLLDKWEIETRRENGGENVLPDIAASLKEKIDGTIKGIGIGVPGPVNDAGVVANCVNLGWGVVDVKSELSRLTGVENIEVGNDANVAGLGEMWKGGGRGYESIVMVTLGTGVGGGVILNGKILYGSVGAGGEIGHMNVNADETDVCGCGNTGCLEQYASATGIVRIAKKNMKEESALAVAGENLSAKMVFDRAKEGDEYALQVVDEFGKYLGTALGNIAVVVDPQAFVIGGGVSRAGEILINAVQKWYNEKAMTPVKNKAFHLAELGNDAGIYGCAKMVIK